MLSIFLTISKSQSNLGSSKGHFVGIEIQETSEVDKQSRTVSVRVVELLLAIRSSSADTLASKPAGLSFEKAAALASAGLERLAEANGLAMHEILEQVTLRHLYRVGANLEPELAARDRGEIADAFEAADEDGAEDGEEG